MAAACQIGGGRVASVWQPVHRPRRRAEIEIGCRVRARSMGIAVKGEPRAIAELHEFAKKKVSPISRNPRERPMGACCGGFEF